MEDMDAEEAIKAHEEYEAQRKRNRRNSNLTFGIGLAIFVGAYLGMILWAAIHP